MGSKGNDNIMGKQDQDHNIRNWYILRRQDLLCGDVLTCQNPTIYTFIQWKILSQDGNKVVVQGPKDIVAFDLDPDTQDRYFVGK